MEAGGVAPANGVIKHGFDVEERDSSNELVAEGLVGLLEEAVGFLLDKVLAIEFGDFSRTGASGVVRLRRWVDRCNEWSVGDAKVSFG